MPKKSLNATINRSRNEKNDEHYTQLSDIENELKHYREHFKGKVVLCNCDDPRCSNFFKYFTINFELLGLKKVIATCYKSQDADLFSVGKCEKAVYQIYEGDKNKNKRVDDEEIEVKNLDGDGSFDSPECLALLEEADIVVTNPPFSRFLDFIQLLIKYNKKFLLIGNIFHAKAKEIFPHFKANRLWMGYYNGNMEFRVPDSYSGEGNRSWVDEKGQKWHSQGNIVWYTNLEIERRNDTLPLFRHYDPAVNFKYFNYDAIDCNRYTDIPCDYDGEIGVPITYLCHHNPEQFELIGTSLSLADMTKVKKRLKKCDGGPTFYREEAGTIKRMFDRVVIRRRA